MAVRCPQHSGVRIQFDADPDSSCRKIAVRVSAGAKMRGAYAVEQTDQLRIPLKDALVCFRNSACRVWINAAQVDTAAGSKPVLLSDPVFYGTDIVLNR